MQILKKYGMVSYAFTYVFYIVCVLMSLNGCSCLIIKFDLFLIFLAVEN